MIKPEQCRRKGLKMNEVIKTIKERRGVKSYLDKPVPKELLDEIIEAGLWAPSGRNSQATIILAVTDKEIMKKIEAVNSTFMPEPKPDPFYGAPMVLIVLGNKANPNFVYEGSIVMQNMMLAAKSLGLGSRWIHRAKQTFELPEWKEFLKKLGIEGDYEGIGNMILGYPAEEPEAAPRNEGRVYFV